LAAAKRVHTETALTQGRISIASAAVEFIRGVFDSFEDKSLLVIGAGKMAELTLTHLRGLNCRSLVVCNRNVARGEELAVRFGGRVRPFTELCDALTAADIVVSSTGAEEPIVGPEQFRPIMAARRNRLVAIIDIAVPRDFHPEVATIENVLLWNIDDLEKVRYKTLRARERELDKALRIVDEETQAFQVVLALQQTGPVIGRLEEEYQQIIERELAWLMPQLNGVSEESRAKIRQFAHRLKNKFLHPPKAALRAEARGGAPHGLIDAFRKLFAIEE
jgi:glutamyl-tRNA reductase